MYSLIRGDGSNETIQDIKKVIHKEKNGRDN